MTTETRLDRGRRMLDRIDGHAGQRVIDALEDIAPDFLTVAACGQHSAPTGRLVLEAWECGRALLGDATRLEQDLLARRCGGRCG